MNQSPFLLLNILIFPGFVFCILAGTLMDCLCRWLSSLVHSETALPFFEPVSEFLDTCQTKLDFTHWKKTLLPLFPALLCLSIRVIIQIWIPLADIGLNRIHEIGDFVVFFFVAAVVELLQNAEEQQQLPVASSDPSLRPIQILFCLLSLIPVFLFVSRLWGQGLDSGFVITFRQLAEVQQSGIDSASLPLLFLPAGCYFFTVPLLMNWLPVNSDQSSSCQTLSGLLRLSDSVRLLSCCTLFASLFFGWLSLGSYLCNLAALLGISLLFCILLRLTVCLLSRILRPSVLCLLFSLVSAILSAATLLVLFIILL